MVSKAGGYFGHLFKGYRCVTRGDPLSQTIFNVVVDAVIRHWVTVVTPSAEGTGGLGLTIMDLATYFYADDGLMLWTQPERTQRVFDVLTGLFYWVVLQKKLQRRLAWSASHAKRQGGHWRRPMRDG